MKQPAKSKTPRPSMGEVVRAAGERAVVRMLSPSEKHLLATAEASVESGLTSAGEALRIIRDQRLYRAEYSSFETYCRERWRYSSRWANMQIAAVIFDGEKLSHSERDSGKYTSQNSYPFHSDEAHDDLDHFAEIEGMDDRPPFDPEAPISLLPLPTKPGPGADVAHWSKKDRERWSDLLWVAGDKTVSLSTSARLWGERLPEEMLPAAEEQARRAVHLCAAGMVRPARAWAGLTQMETEQHGHSSVRHYSNLLAGLKKVRTSGGEVEWDTLSERQQRELRKVLLEAVGKFGPELFQIVQEALAA
jgi:hypothetical protein